MAAVLGSAISGEEKFLSNHQEEIQFIKELLAKSALTVRQMMKGLSPSRHSHGQNAIEGPSGHEEQHIEGLSPSPHSHGQNAIEGPSGHEEQHIEDSNFIQED